MPAVFPVWPLLPAAQAEAQCLKVWAGEKEALLQLIAPAGGAPEDRRILGKAVQRSLNIQQSDFCTDAPLP